MLHSHAYRVEEHQDNDEPVEPLGLHCVSDPKPKPLLGPPEVRESPGGPRFTFQKTCCDEANVSKCLDFRVAVDLANY